MKARDQDFSDGSSCRAAIAPFLANVTAGIESYKWMLFGDDDTAFYIDNALRMLSTLDHNMPYVLSDHNWFPTDLQSKLLVALSMSAFKCNAFLLVHLCYAAAAACSSWGCG